jgi:leucyl-tRNA synthetase
MIFRSRELSTTDEKYVKWTQWIFLQMFHAGLAVQSEVPVNWCPKLGKIATTNAIQ